MFSFNEGNLLKNNKNPKEIEICKFIIAVTNNKKSCYRYQLVDLLTKEKLTDLYLLGK